MPLDLIMEDRTGLNTTSDFDDIYDRLFFHVAPLPERPMTIMIYSMHIRASRHRNSLPLTRPPSVILNFTREKALGTISFAQRDYNVSFSMSRYLRRTSIFGWSVARKFIGSDGRMYKWDYQSVKGHEWTCTTSENYPVAHYDLKAPGAPTFGLSGNTLTIDEYFSYLTAELLASLTIMRHIAQHNLWYA